MADAEADAAVRCRCFTYARRFPLVIGKVGGATLWWPLSILQMSTLCGSVVVLFATRGAWAHLSAAGNVLVGVGLPVALTWMVRHLRLEGRSPLRALLGAATYACSPRTGLYHGRPYRRPRARPVAARVAVDGEASGGGG